MGSVSKGFFFGYEPYEQGDYCGHNIEKPEGDLPSSVAFQRPRTSCYAVHNKSAELIAEY